jgi:hypothetical protein
MIKKPSSSVQTIHDAVRNFDLENLKEFIAKNVNFYVNLNYLFKPMTMCVITITDLIMSILGQKNTLLTSIRFANQ